MVAGAGLSMGCSSVQVLTVDAIWAAAAAADRNRISSTRPPYRLTYPPESRLQPYARQSATLKVSAGRDRDTNVRERDGSGTQTGGSGTGAGQLLAGRAGAGLHDLSRATL